MKKGSRWILFLLLIAAAFLWKMAYNNYKLVEKMNNLTTYYHIAEQTMGEYQRINQKELESSHPTDFVLWYQSNKEVVNDPLSQRSEKVSVIHTAGDSRLILPVSVTLDMTDRKGCIIDGETAEILFGTTNVVGSTIVYGEEDYTVRSVFLTPTKTMILVAGEAVPLTMLTVREGSAQGGSFLEKWGLSAKFTLKSSYSLYIGRLLLAVPTLIILFFLLRGLLVGGKVNENSPVGKTFINLSIIALVTGAILFLLILLPKEFLPNRWSDFDFWNKQVKALQSFMVDYGSIEKTRQHLLIKEYLWRIGGPAFNSSALLYFSGRQLMCKNKQRAKP